MQYLPYGEFLLLIPYHPSNALDSLCTEHYGLAKLRETPGKISFKTLPIPSPPQSPVLFFQTLCLVLPAQLRKPYFVPLLFPLRSESLRTRSECPALQIPTPLNPNLYPSKFCHQPLLFTETFPDGLLHFIIPSSTSLITWDQEI